MLKSKNPIDIKQSSGAGTLSRPGGRKKADLDGFLMVAVVC